MSARPSFVAARAARAAAAPVVRPPRESRTPWRTMTPVLDLPVLWTVVVATTLPPSVNARYARGGTGFLCVRDETRAWEAETGWMIRTEMSRAGRKLDPLSPFSVAVKLHNPRTDIDNTAKAILDCAIGIVYRSDNQVQDYHPCNLWSLTVQSVVIAYTCHDRGAR